MPVVGRQAEERRYDGHTRKERREYMRRDRCGAKDGTWGGKNDISERRKGGLEKRQCAASD